MKTFAEAQAVLAQNLPGYEPRPQQMALAEKIEQTLTLNAAVLADREKTQGLTPTHLFGQAGTGCGKSLGYLIPAILSGHRTIVSVTTKALQAQLQNLDLPFLAEHLGIDFSWTILKGRSNYVCLNRMALADEAEIPSLPRLVKEANAPGFGGERSDFSVQVTDAQWSMICSDADECKGCGDEDAPGRCFAREARTYAQQCQVVVVNHALLGSDLVLASLSSEGHGMLGEYDLVVIDEAHEFAESVSGVIGGRFSQGSVAHLVNQIQSWSARYAEDGDTALTGPLGSLTAATEDLFDALPSSERRESIRLDISHIEAAAEAMQGFYAAMSAVGQAFRQAKVSPQADLEVARKRRDRIAREANSLHRRFVEIVGAEFTDVVRWVEYEQRHDRRSGRKHFVKVVNVAPISVAPFLSEMLFSRTPVVMVSATLAVKGGFGFAAGQLGVERYDGIDVGTPFDYGTQARIYTPRLPDPAKEGPAWEAAVSEEIVDLCVASQGRALVLFTSVAHMRRAHESVSRRLSSMTVKMQGQESVADLSAWFSGAVARGEKAVLFGVKSFFTGFDIRGEGLTNVIIVKMPFPVPTEPLFAARCDKVQSQGGNPFADLTIPMMSLVFQQAAGRLIRHSTDMGVISILDHRIQTKNYGKTIIRDLPPAPVVRTLPEVEAFFREVSDHFGFEPEEAQGAPSLAL